MVNVSGVFKSGKAYKAVNKGAKTTYDAAKKEAASLKSSMKKNPGDKDIQKAYREAELKKYQAKMTRDSLKGAKPAGKNAAQDTGWSGTKVALVAGGALGAGVLGHKMMSN